MVEPEIEKRFKDAQEALAVLKEKKKNNGSLNSSGSKSILIGVPIIIFGILIWTNSNKWRILSNLGVVPENICEPKIMTNYLIKGGNPNARRTPFLDKSYSLSDCFDNIEDLKLFELFINKGGIPNQKQILKDKAISPEIALVLYKNRISLNNTQQKEFTWQLFNTSKGIASILIANGADIKTRNRDGNTLLHITKNQEIALLAIKQGININATDKDGNTPLHYAESPEIVKLLIKQGANISYRNILGKTPLHLAAIHKSYTYFLEELLEAGANINIKDNQGKTPLDYARSGKNERIIKFFKFF
ncbi:ankyrin repeat domain-containing protein [Pleurocapsales cyanobacterium LEGE 06147]|nr:ankyrin repeat domain-containing protein [Pleurocapsales cyanobacterium LEGE 06147]